jgi:hypothetical protein
LGFFPFFIDRFIHFHHSLFAGVVGQTNIESFQ